MRIIQGGTQQQRDLLDKKLEIVMTRLSARPEVGGDPFIFTWVINKKHTITDKIRIAATDGHQYFWNPKVIEYDPDVLKWMLVHETLHIILGHNERKRGLPNKSAAAAAIDYAVHAVMWKAYSEINQSRKKYDSPTPPFDYVTISQLCNGEKKQGEIVLFSDPDPSVLKMSIRDIYEKIEDCVPDLDDNELGDGSDGQSQDNDQSNNGSDNPFLNDNEQFDPFSNNRQTQPSTPDDHDIQIDMSPDEVEREIQRAFAGEQQIIGNNPGSSPGFISQFVSRTLLSKKIDLRRYVRHLAHKTKGEGKISWKRPRRRYISQGRYLPRQESLTANYIAFVDTSASMSTNAVMDAISQLYYLEKEGIEGKIYLVDTEVYWDNPISPKDPSFNMTGRGGTDFDAISNEIWDHNDKDTTDIVFIITDGGLYTYNMKPIGVPTVWVIIEGDEDFKPPFGKVVVI